MRNPKPPQKKNTTKSKGNNAARRTYNAAIPYSPGTPMTTLKIDGASQKFTTTVTTGLIATSYAINLGNMPNFATRFGVVFDEARILEARFKFRPCSSTTPGMCNTWVEPISNSAPTAAFAASNKVVSFSMGSNDRVKTLIYRPSDFQYMEFVQASTTSTTVGYLNIYTDNANYASPIAVTDAFVLRAEYIVQFRGYV
jgi:hypothetical protein